MAEPLKFDLSFAWRLWNERTSWALYKPKKGALKMPAYNRKDLMVWAGHCYDPPNHDKVYVVWIEDRGDKYAVVGGYDKRINNKPLRMRPYGDFPSLESAKSQMYSVIRSKKGKYIDIESSEYYPKMWTLEQALTRIDTSRLVGYNTPKAAAPAAPAKPIKIKPLKPGSGRVSRTLDV